jgi:1-acyl-sn-glycerol-3-phosphate acyltransferase
MLPRKIHIVLSVPVFLFLYAYTAVLGFLIMAFYPDVSWFGYERLLRIPRFKQMLLMTDYIPMRINNIKNTRVMLETLEQKAQDRTVAIFSEGTRTLDAEIVLTTKHDHAIELFIDFGKKVPFHVDGELYFDAKFEVKTLPSSVNIIFNPGGNHFFNEEV